MFGVRDRPRSLTHSLTHSLTRFRVTIPFQPSQHNQPRTVSTPQHNTIQHNTTSQTQPAQQNQPITNNQRIATRTTNATKPVQRNQHNRTNPAQSAKISLPYYFLRLQSLSQAVLSYIFQNKGLLTVCTYDSYNINQNQCNELNRATNQSIVCVCT